MEGGYLLYYPPAFTPESQDKIVSRVPTDKRLVLEEGDAVAFACNAVELEGHVFMNAASARLQKSLRTRGFIPHIIPLSEFMKAGGAAKCLTLKLVEK